jgi:NAD(P)H-dependent flavin oxidoreductase YrpB (nitropropane dioxygenase family)
MIGIGSAGCALQLDEQLRHLRELGRPFGIGLVAWVIASEPQLLTAAIAAKPALLSVSFGEDFSWVRRAHDAGIAAATQVGNLRAAARAAEAGCDVVTASGAEAGGHGEPTVGTLPLLAAILDHASAQQIHRPLARSRTGAVRRPCPEALAAAIAADDHRLAPINAGQGVAMLPTVRPAAEVIDQLVPKRPASSTAAASLAPARDLLPAPLT